MQKGDIVLVPFPFSDLSGKKLRPALILCSSPLDITVCFITTQFQWREKHDIELLPSSSNGIKKTSIIRVGKFATIDKDLVIGKLGELEFNYVRQLNKNLKEILQLA
ncbi:type II toxin-antitoxin system PemK/MazF family toxin [Maribellus sp. YY47]|uniref:type II toxin-antitoxin system PemK/MazF family toxin n=1 Tax=Maribellus sp. YY47 TaxID=2929486 RepID=UPI0020008729|nr:type II toxin-antitoxin system PemK/MazF family toxin [Maribellus sp. YY47]MCK3684492.1 type II toxin-antitoxin system PemK/MazF family toxin [Maribellus sp. YY47]